MTQLNCDDTMIGDWVFVMCSAMRTSPMRSLLSRRMPVSDAVAESMYCAVPEVAVCAAVYDVNDDDDDGVGVAAASDVNDDCVVLQF